MALAFFRFEAQVLTEGFLVLSSRRSFFGCFSETKQSLCPIRGKRMGLAEKGRGHFFAKDHDLDTEENGQCIGSARTGSLASRGERGFRDDDALWLRCRDSGLAVQGGLTGGVTFFFPPFPCGFGFAIAGGGELPVPAVELVLGG
jgi:hypothetical protein